MPALNFQARWADAVELGALHANNERVIDEYVVIPKRTTIRKPGRAKPGDTLYLYTGQRTKECRKLGEVLCLFVAPVRIARERITHGGYIHLGTEQTNKALLSGPRLDQFARLDTAGQWNAAQFIGFFEDTYGLPFDGELIGW